MKRKMLSGLILLCAMVLAARAGMAQAYVSAAINWPGDKAQFFLSDGTYVRYDMAADRADAGYPKAIDGSTWPGFNGHGGYIMAAFNGLNGKAYFFFSDGTYSRYDIAADHMDAGYPKQVTNETWPGLGAYAGHITAALNWPGDKVQFFLDDGTYIRYDLVADRADAGYPARVTEENWPGLAPYAGQITCTVNWQNGKAYFFMGDGRYLRYDIAADKVDDGYPQRITPKNWPGLDAYFRRH
jgi:hypothetical protein